MAVDSLDALESEISLLVMDVCRVTDLPVGLTPNSPLIGPDSPFGLDSLDAVEIVVAIQRAFDVRIDQQTGREALRSLSTLAEYVRARRKAT